MADIVGGPGDDILDGTDGADVIRGNGGNDQIDGKGGNDRLYGDDGNDVVHGGDGNDELSGGIGVNQLYGDDGDDRLILDGFVSNGSGHIFDGGAGSDVLWAEGGDISGATIIGIEAVTTYGATLAMTIEQMNGFSSIGYENSPFFTAGYRLTNGGSISFSGKSVTEGRFDLANADTIFDLTGVIVVQGPIFGDPMFPPDGYIVTGGSGADTITGAQTHDHLSGKGGNDILNGAAGNDVLEGGIGDDILDGGTGNDILFGSAGLDILLGGDGNDELHVDGDLVAGEVYDGGAGVDQIYLNSGNYDLNALGVTFANIEGITLATGGRLAMTTAQLGQFSSLVGGTYILTTAGTVALPGAIVSGATFILSDLGNGFDLGLSNRSATVTGGASADYIIGSAFNDILAGGGGDDVILGGGGNDQLTGGAGANRLSGGTGNDTYYIQSSADLVFENAGGGLDKIFIANDFYLYANVEDLTLTGSGNYFGVGNDLANTITGNSGDNLLIAGAGDDNISGGGGNDLIFGEDGADRIFGGAGIDYIVAGAGNDIVVGDDGADEIYGGDGSDVLTGGSGFFTDILVGGLGNDTLHGDSGLGDYDLLYGNTGNDTFYVDTPDDLVFENAGEGTDTVYAKIDGAGYYLYDNIENLSLDGNTPFGVGNALDNRMMGSDSANYLLGGAGNDTLNGMGGNDVLFGEAGNDIFVFTRGTGADVIGDFTRGQDRIDLTAFGITSLSQISNFFAQDGDVGAIQFASGEVIVLHNVQMNQLTAGDFIFAAAAKEAGDSPVKAALGGVAQSFDIHSPAAEGQWHGGTLWTPLDYSIPAWFG